ncbi:M64 family metallopeptidase [Mangrovibacterium marinum]|uniref:Peptidase M64-like protein n=1 Tax=Mangrovibacterium marinum TaxID=1639118 RepID=A0A2T5C0I4_9BACT|nr:M64 family metallopeptidase [Mangrovibacterium marinum]PTN08122.1 peptidase M64-like protein [Mangrovibacterium marinum]
MTRFVWILLMLVCPFGLKAQISFDKYFEARTLRIDFTLAGNDEQTELFLEQMKRQGEWAGSHTHLVDEENYGNFRYQLRDPQSGEVLFSRGFCSLFQEWQTTPEAATLSRSYYHVALMPFPKKKVKFVVEMRTWEGVFKELLNLEVKPNDYFIVDEKGAGYPVIPVMENGPHAEKVDLVFLAEGYQADEMDKFQQDIKRLTDYLFAMKPYDKHKQDFNLYAVLVPSAESGTDVPGKGVYKNTAFNSNFYTFDEARYLTSKDLKAIHDAASGAVYDQLYVLVNSDTYGGGGFYNYLNLTTVDNERSPQVFVHEFGHGFAGLADEYYSSSVAYDEFYNRKVEPWEPNITTLVDFDRKWKSMIEADIPQPTPRVARYDGVVGLFEGGGYAEKGIYSPVMDCRMKTNEAPGFCPVCSRAIEKAIQSYSE